MDYPEQKEPKKNPTSESSTVEDVLNFKATYKNEVVNNTTNFTDNLSITSGTSVKKAGNIETTFEKKTSGSTTIVNRTFDCSKKAEK